MGISVDRIKDILCPFGQFVKVFMAYMRLQWLLDLTNHRVPAPTSLPLLFQNTLRYHI